jgi:hypothetical protein
MKITRALTGTFIFILALLVIYWLHVSYFKVDVVFYAAIFDGFLAAFVAGCLMWALPFFKPLGEFEKFLLVVLWLMTGYGWAISVPTVIDRSLSFYILEKIQQRGGGIRQDAFERIFVEEYLKEHRLVDVRLTEQMESGTIFIEDGCVLLTPKGELIARFSREFRQNWLPKQRLLLGQYSDALTDPFRDSTEVNNYVCGK